MKNILSENAQKIAEARYFNEGENWETATLRVADGISEPENGKRKYYTEKFHEMIYNQLFIPAGRILRNTGKLKGSILNCYHLPVGDSIEEIGQAIKDSLILWSEGGGVGINFSSLRPMGDQIKGKGGKTSGLVSFMEVFDSAAQRIESGGQRRAAAMGIVHVEHPEVMDFIDAKLSHGKFSCFNISVAINNEFLDKVEKNEDWEFRFNQRSYGTLPARQIWSKIVSNMVYCGEPGLINFDNFTNNQSYYFQPILGSNPCNEAVLAGYEACDLGSLVLPNFITGTTNTNWKKLEETIKLAVRFLDNVLDVNKYALTQIDIKCHNSRKIGLGVMGLAEYLFAKGLRYGTAKSIREIERLFKFIRDATFQASIELSVEKGSFPKFDPYLYSKSGFISKLPVNIRMDIKKMGIRNCTLLAMAPTGTISLIADCTSGIEPLFCKGYIRRDRVSERIYIHPRYEELLKTGHEIPDWFVDAYDLKPEEHFEVQSTIQKYVDASCSKTINLPNDYTDENLSGLLLEYMRDCKGCTVYRDGSRGGQVLTPLSKEEAMEFLNLNSSTSERNEGDVKCANGKCDL